MKKTVFAEAASQVASGLRSKPIEIKTLGPAMQVEFSDPGQVQATPNGQVVFFSQFLEATGLFKKFVECCSACAKALQR